MSLRVRITGGDRLRRFANTLAREGSCHVVVGILNGSTYPDGTPTALVAAVQEFGSAKGNIPARSFMRSTFAQRHGNWRQGVKSLIRQGYTARQALTLLGEQMAGDIKAQIGAIASPTLKPATILGKRSAKPLIDTAHLQNSIAAEVRDGLPE